MSPVKLFIPGPCEVDDDVLDAMAQPVMRHYGAEWLEVYHETLALLKQVFETQHDLLIVPGPGSAALDMAIGSVLASGQKIIVGDNGFFGERLVAIASSCGLDVVRFESPLGQPLAPGVLDQLLEQHPDAVAVAIVHHETATTVLNPLQELAELTHRAGRVIIVDAMSSLGGVELPVDAWQIDVCVTATNKCLEAPPGLALASIGPRAWELVDSQPATQHGWYLNLKTWRTYAHEWRTWHPYPVTLPTNIILALRASLLKIVAGGLPAHRAKYVRASQAMRAGLGRLGFEAFVPEAYAAPVATAFKARPEFGLAELMGWLASQRAIAVGGGLGALAGQIFRVGHLGKAASPEYVDALVSGVGDFLYSKGLS